MTSKLKPGKRRTAPLDVEALFCQKPSNWQLCIFEDFVLTQCWWWHKKQVSKLKFTSMVEVKLGCTNTHSSVTSLLDCYMRNMTTNQTVTLWQTLFLSLVDTTKSLYLECRSYSVKWLLVSLWILMESPSSEDSHLSSIWTCHRYWQPGWHVTVKSVQERAGGDGASVVCCLCYIFWTTLFPHNGGGVAYADMCGIKIHLHWWKWVMYLRHHILGPIIVDNYWFSNQAKITG